MDEDNKFTLPTVQGLEDVLLNGNIVNGGALTFNAAWAEQMQEVYSILNDGSLFDSSVNENNQQITISGGNVMEEELRSNGYVVDSTVQSPPQIPTVGSNIYQASALPAIETWPGEYGFTISFNPQPKSTKGVSWTFSKIKDKLYVGKDVSCPVNISAKTKLPDNTYNIRVMALYSSSDQITEVVKRCINHSMEETTSGLVEAEHLIRCDSSAATYHVDPVTKRHSVVVPFENPPVGQQFSTYIYKFACFGSCSGGPNRRPLMLIFTLECGNQVVGRRKLDVKICACPGRDKRAEEAQYLRLEAPNLQRAAVPVKRKHASEYTLLTEVLDFTKSIYTPLPKKPKAAPNKDGVYVLTTEDFKCFEFLKQMKKFYEICKVMKNVTPDVLSKVLHQAKGQECEK